MLIGIVGKPSAGKSTFFKAATLADVPIAQYPFTTIKPNHGVGYVKVECIDKELNTQCQPNHGFCLNHWRFVPVELMDVAGLVPGASEGKGLGNQFLDDLRQADTFIQIVDVSGTTDREGKLVLKGSSDPVDDVKFLEEELNKWYFNILMKVWRSFARKAEMTSKDNFSEAVAKQFSGLKIKEEQVKTVLRKLNFKDNPSSWDNDQLMNFASELRKESKPMIIAANKIDLPSSKENYEKLKKEFPDLMIIPCSADSELALKEAAKSKLIDYIPGENDFNIKGEINEKQKQALKNIKKNILEVYKNTGVQNILNAAVFELLKYLAIFPAGSKLKDSKGHILPDCFLLPENSTALDLAYFIHTDIGNNFIKAIDVRTKRVLGKNHILKNRDVLEIVIR